MLKSRSRSGPQRRHLDLKEAIIAFIKLKNMVKYHVKQRKFGEEWKVVRCKYALPKKRKPSDFVKMEWENYEKHSLTKWRRYFDKWTMQEWLKMEEKYIANGKVPMLQITEWTKDYEWQPPVAGEHFGTVMLPIGDHPFDPFQSDLEVEETTDDEEPGEDDGLKPTPSADRPKRKDHGGAKIKLRIDDPKPWKLTSLVRSGIEKLVGNKRKDQDDSSSSSDRGSRKKKKKKHDKSDDLETDLPSRKRSDKRRREIDLCSDSEEAEQELLPLHGLMCVAGGGYQTTLWAHHSMGCVHKSMLRCA